MNNILGTSHIYSSYFKLSSKWILKKNESPGELQNSETHFYALSVLINNAVVAKSDMPGRKYKSTRH